jgi:cytochrome o ubiquinol oxidase subunit 1
MVWYMWWLAALSFVGIVGYAIYHTFNYKREYHFPLDEVIRSEEDRTRLLLAARS